MQVNMDEAKSRLTELGELAWQGEEVIIAKAGKPFLRLAPYEAHESQAEKTDGAKPRRLSGALKGQIWIAPDFDDTPEELIDLFYDGEIFPGEKPESSQEGRA